ncbi:MAG TPA: radical SAM protein [Gemmatimonadaceae bacterium]
MATEVARLPVEAHIRGARARRVPLNCLFEITPTCNLRCQFCYVALDPYKGPYLSTDQIKEILDTLERAGVLWLTLTGGEIFSRRDFREIYLYARAKGFLVTLFSNATMMNEKLAELFTEHPPFLVEVSIYGPNAEIYEQTTQIPGSFARFERGITLLQQCGAPLVLKTPMSVFTQEHLAELAAYAKARGLRYKVDTAMDPRHDGGAQPVVYRIAPRRVKQLHDEMDRINGKIELTSEGASAMTEAPQHLAGPSPVGDCSATVAEATSEDLYRCGAGRTGLFVDALGNASHCVIDRDPSFSLLEMEWDDVWARIGEWVTQPLPKDAPCSGCTLRKKCASCPARSRLATGSPYLKDPYYCDVTHVVNGLEPVVHPDYRMMAPRALGACAS